MIRYIQERSVIRNNIQDSFPQKVLRFIGGLFILINVALFIAGAYNNLLTTSSLHFL